MYKSKLHELCQKNNLGSPAYSFIKEGKDHCPTFRGKVVVKGFTFISESIFAKSKLAANDVARQALDHFTTFTLPTVDVQNAKRQKVSTVEESRKHEIPSKTNEFSSPALAEEKTKTTPLDSMNVDSYLLCNKVRVYTSIPTTVLPKGCVVLPIGDNQWTIVSLE